MTRKEKISRYRHLRAIAKQHHNAAIKFVGGPTMMEIGRRIKLVHGNTIICDSVDDMAYIFDLALYTSKEGRSRGIDRYARTVRAAPGSDEALMLKAAQEARFTLWRVEGLHETAGLTIWDIGNDRPLWLIDEGFEATARAGDIFAGRLKWVDDFVMTTGAAVPLDDEAFSEVWAHIPRMSATSKSGLIEDPRFAIAVFRTLLREGTEGKIAFRDPGAPGLDTEAA
jgi:hypothetical protein